ncbi:galactoside 2-alpha-L-fucosyltransferase 1 [Biomphalaria glabrata]|nr:galactoside 2-alpha-L-fucosyltransferase 1 [Biomphalaria glabrata]
MMPIQKFYFICKCSPNYTNTSKTAPMTTLDRHSNTQCKTTASLQLDRHSNTTNRSCLYLSTSFTGRIGNQMFIYATMVGLARAQNRMPFINTGGDLLTIFPITNIRTDINTTGWSVIGESGYATFDSKFMNLPQRNLTLAGYLQSWRYFLHAQDEIRQEFTLVPSLQKEADAVLASCRSHLQNHVIVGVHVRRGDFVLDHKQKFGYGVANASYFVKAFAKIRSLLPNQNITFLVASDNLTWCKDNIKDTSVTFLPERDRGIHFAILSSCDHVILTSGTFGWWIAWLANGISIYFEGYIKKDSPLEAGFTSRDYYPLGWIGLGN